MKNIKKRMTLDEIRLVELDLLRHFKLFCQQNNIHFFLSNGTLLGAVKYKGFIPWDDDIDVFVPRADYDKLIQKYKDNTQYCLFSIERNSSYRFPFAKLCNMKTIKIEDNIDNGVQLGVDIDIFPLDVWANDHKAAEKQVKDQCRRIKILTFLKCRSATSLNPIKRVLKSIFVRIVHPFGIPFILKKIKKTATAYTEYSTALWRGCVSWCIYGRNEIVQADVFRNTTDVIFEGDIYPAPIGFDSYLKSLYGNYNIDPPLNEQKTHHNYQAFFTTMREE